MKINSREYIVLEASRMGIKALPDEAIKPGDLYVAMRNNGLRLLTCRSVVEVEDFPGCVDFVVPVEHGEYCYDGMECVRVV